MKSGCVALCAAALCAGIAFSAAPANAQSKMKACADEWNAKKAANEVGNLKYREFQKECLARTAATPGKTPATPAAATPAPAPEKSATAPAGTPPAATTEKPSAGRQAFFARERACGAEWKADKAAGKVAAGTKWPQYLHECNARKKAEGL